MAAGRRLANSSNSERSRERLIRELYDKTCERTREIFSRYDDSISYVLYGGERQTLGGFKKRCKYMERFKEKTLGRVLRIDRPNRAALDKIHEEIWSSEVYFFEREALDSNAVTN